MGLLSLAIWTPIVFGVVLLALGRDDQARTVRWVALIGAIASFLVTLPLYVLDQSLDYIAGLGMERIEAHTLAMSGALRQRLAGLGVPVMTPEPAAARAASIAFEHADPQAVREALEAADVLVTGELGRVRASVHVYTTGEDLAAAADTLRDVLG